MVGRILRILTLLCVMTSVCAGPAARAVPDLVVEDIWRDANTSAVWVSITNSGDGIADGAVTCALAVKGSPFDDLITADIAPGETRHLAFGNPIELTGAAIHVSITVDSGENVAESNEANNERLEAWSSDSDPPAFTALPAIESLDDTAAEISVSASEPVSVRMFYGVHAGMRGLSAEITLLDTSHVVRIEGLDPDTMYEAVAEISDAGENRVHSLPFHFRTAMQTPDGELPALGIPPLAPLTGRVQIAVEAADPTLDRVEFSVDGSLVATDYSPPYVLDLDTSLYGDGTHPLQVDAVDRAGNRASDSAEVSLANPIDASVPTAQINEDFPPPVQGKLLFDVHAQDDIGIAALNYYVDGICRGQTKYAVGARPTTADISYV